MVSVAWEGQDIKKCKGSLGEGRVHKRSGRRWGISNVSYSLMKKYVHYQRNSIKMPKQGIGEGEEVRHSLLHNLISFNWP